MGRDAYLHGLRQRIRDLGLQMEEVRAKLTRCDDDALRVDLRGELERLDLRREELRNKLRDFENQPPGAWADLKADVEQEWDLLVQDFEERVGRLL